MRGDRHCAAADSRIQANSDHYYLASLARVSLDSIHTPHPHLLNFYSSSLPTFMLRRSLATTFIRAAAQRPTVSFIPKAKLAAPFINNSPSYTRSKTTTRVPFPTMSAVSDQDILARFSKLSIAAPDVVNHSAVAGGAEWRAELDKLGKTGVPLTKTVCWT